jgi:putative ABC transport system permease protein
MNLAKQFWALLGVNLAGVPARLGLVLTIVIGVACAVGVLVSMLAMGVGARQEAMGDVSPNRAVLTSVDAPSPAQSNIAQDAAALIRSLPGIRRNPEGKPIVVFQATVFVQARSRIDRTQTGFPLIGVTPGLTDYQPELRVTAGRMFNPGVHELVASNKCVRQYTDFGVDLASTVCVVFADGDTILSAFGRNTYNQANVMLESPAAFVQLSKALKANPTLHLKVQHEAEIFEQNMQQINGILNFISYFVGSIMALAATIGAANSLYAIVDGRRRELAILRAVGFNSTPIIASVVSESILLALPGALIGALVAWLLFNGLLASPLGASFHMAVTPSLAFLGLGWALCIGVIAGLLPALRAARVPVTTAMRAT